MRVVYSPGFLLLLLVVTAGLCLPACKEKEKKKRKKRDRTHQKEQEKAKPKKEKKEESEPERVEGYGKPQSADPDWTTGSVEYVDKAMLYAAAVLAEEAVVYPDPVIIAGSATRLPRGHLVEVLDTHGPQLALDGRNKTALPVRALGHVGWVFKSQLRRLPPLAATPGKLWAVLWDQGNPGRPMPRDCVVRAILAEMSEIPGEEVVIYGSGLTECGKALGVFSLVDGMATLLAVRFDLETTDISVRRHSRGTAFLDVTTYWMGGPALMGNRQYLLGLDLEVGSLEPHFEVDKAVVDSSTQPARYLLSQLAFPDPDENGDWFIQHQFIEKVMVDARGRDTVTETFYRWDGKQFVVVEPPAGIKPLPVMNFDPSAPPPDAPGQQPAM